MICIGTGNEGRSAGHTAGAVSENEETVIQLAVQQAERTLNLQIWKAYFDIMDISLKNNDLTEGKIWKVLLRFILPIFFGDLYSWFKLYINIYINILIY